MPFFGDQYHLFALKVFVKFADLLIELNETNISHAQNF